MPKGIPKYVQVLNKVEVLDDKLKEHLIKAYELDGIQIDDDMKRRNPNAKERVICISVKAPKVMMAGAEEFGAKDEKMGHWVYCGNLYYVRKLTDDYEFAQYLAYDTENKETVGLWDAREYN